MFILVTSGCFTLSTAAVLDFLLLNVNSSKEVSLRFPIVGDLNKIDCEDN